jgi:hypothetical protein
MSAAFHGCGLQWRIPLAALGGSLMDVVFLALVVVLFALSYGFVRLCEKLQ